MALVRVGWNLTMYQAGAKSLMTVMAPKLTTWPLAVVSSKAPAVIVVAFTLSFVSSNLSYVWPVLSDPLGWGWNLLGTTDLAWTPYGATVLPILQAGVLLGGLAWTGAAVRHVAADLGPGGSVVRRAAPVLSFAGVLTVVFLELLVA